MAGPQIDDPVTGKSLKGPFAYVGDAIDVPMVVSWTAPNVTVVLPNIPHLLKINSTKISSLSLPDLIWETIKDLIEGDDVVKITFGDALNVPVFIPFKGNEVDYDALRVTVCNLFGIDPASDILRVNPGLEELIALCVIVFILAVASPIAIGGAIFVVVLAIAIILAVLNGYKVEVTRTDSASVGTSVSTPIPLSDLQVTLTPPA